MSSSSSNDAQGVSCGEKVMVGGCCDETTGSGGGCMTRGGSGGTSKIERAHKHKHKHTEITQH